MTRRPRGYQDRVHAFKHAEELLQIGAWSLGTGGQLHLSDGAAALLAAPAEWTIDSFLAVLTAHDQKIAQTFFIADDPGPREIIIRLPAAERALKLIRGEGVDPTFGFVKDVTREAALSYELSQSEERQRQFESLSQEWLWEMDASHRFTYVSETIEKILGVPASDHLGKTRRELQGERNEALEMEMHLAWVDQNKPFHDFRHWQAGPAGKEHYVSISGEPIYNAEGTFCGYRGTGHDMTGQQQIREALLLVNRQLNSANKAKSDALSSLKEANSLLEERNDEMERVQEEVRHSALHDALTGLANRRYLDSRLSEAVDEPQKLEAPLGVLHVDLDRFKEINDTLGHAAGDAVLQHVAQTLRSSIDSEDFAARVGGDEFVIMTVGKSEDALLAMAQTIIDRLARPFIFKDRECWFGASVGIAIAKGQISHARGLLAQADMALYRAKRRGRGCAEVFSEDVQREILHQKRLADGIQGGLDRGEFIPWYQPQIDTRDFKICGLEALARWQPPIGEPKTPDVFLNVAADLNKVQAIDRMILERAVADLAGWDRTGVNVPRLSVNVSARRLVEPDLVESLRELSPPTGRLAFELLESVFLDDLEQSMSWNIDALKSMGIDIELDDFGSGHASIVSLVKLAPDAIKIDRRMIAGVTLDNAHRDLAEALIGIGKTLGVRVVAEGVETLEQAVLLAGLGCDVLQGYLIAKPMHADAVPRFIADWRDPRQTSAAVAG
ncbi:MAG: EAL domain-containing protein [Pseudomonadota bacterium]